MSQLEPRPPWFPEPVARQLPLYFPTVPQVQMAVEARFVQDTLKGDGVTEIRMRFIRRIEDNLPAGEE